MMTIEETEAALHSIVNALPPEVFVDLNGGVLLREEVKLSPNRLADDLYILGEFEERLKSVLNEVVKSDGQILLFIDEVHTVVGAGATDGAMDAGNLLKPMMARGEIGRASCRERV